MSPGSSTESYPAFAHIGLRENPGKNLNQVTCPDRDSNPGHLVSRPDALTVTPQASGAVRSGQQEGYGNGVPLEIKRFPKCRCRRASGFPALWAVAPLTASIAIGGQSRFQTIAHMFSELSHRFLPCDRSFGLVESQKRKHGMFRRTGIKSSKTAPKSLKSFQTSLDKSSQVKDAMKLACEYVPPVDMPFYESLLCDSNTRQTGTSESDDK
ncbi:hypothetical protein ANN_06632 [Periplaneta americana]|uniref:Uncharacterized protein n=1 Tax=Periplaneta americana TaxID=6978 RepID=A0ABQ8TE83_PERAM|nr:hypothetical protein ANN_06632 [Periplaneta americana]